MPLVLFCRRGTPVDPQVLAIVETQGIPFAVELIDPWGVVCPICAHARAVHFNRSLAHHECWACFCDFWAIMEDDGNWRCSTDDPRVRTAD